MVGLLRSSLLNFLGLAVSFLCDKMVLAEWPLREITLGLVIWNAATLKVGDAESGSGISWGVDASTSPHKERYGRGPKDKSS